MIVRICDRCKKQYEYRGARRLKLMRVTGDPTLWRYSQVDLCENCFSALFEWFFEKAEVVDG